MRIPNFSAGPIAILLLVAALLHPHTANAQADSTLKVLSWNTHHGVGTDGAYDLQRFVSLIARSGAQVVSLNEVHKNDFWGNEDQPERYAALLRAATSRTWYYTFAQRAGKTNGEGNLLLSTFPIEAASATILSYSRSVARAQIVVNGVRVNVFSLHLDADSATRRTRQISELRSWASNFSQEHIIAGDFNAWPGAAEISTMTAFARDGWATAKANGTAVAYDGNDAGNTRNSRIDYIWYSRRASQLALQGARVFDTRDSDGVMPSDHRPVMATFEVGAATSVASNGVSTTAVKLTGDFDGDWKSDLSVYRPGTGEWFVFGSSGTGIMQLAWGTAGDVAVPGDYDGDGRQDVAVFRPLDATWYVRETGTGVGRAIPWGIWGDIAAPGDYDGDGRSDVAVFRPATGEWYVRYANSGAGYSVHWGTGGDVPVPGDYDGDGRADIAVFRPANGVWYLRYSRTGTTAILQWGDGGDVAVSGDYDGDGKTDCAVFRPSNGTWYVRYASTGATAEWQWGTASDRPAPGDYDGDGKFDLAVFRPSNATWYLRYSQSGAEAGVQWGAGDDIPLPGR